ncbi:hypothetical protein CXB51_033919 [Gossypium anomalum]|uniref:Uncharacterized protein n=1 Tax=Gossypium anomalum TaxID=47600 RepID=A0A8J5XQJ8_9ROSI|nr:hypothetical protein CXB51_033919 [Gossypium anomalum]
MPNPKQTDNNKMTSKATRGRQKVEMKKLQKESSRQASSSSLPKGNLSSLATLLSKPYWIVILVEALLWMITRTIRPRLRPVYVSKSCMMNAIEEALEKLKEEKKRIEHTKEAMKNKGEFWWDEAIDDNMGLEELEAYLKAIEELRNNVARKANESMMCDWVPDSGGYFDFGIAADAFNFDHCPSQDFGAAGQL